MTKTIKILVIYFSALILNGCGNAYKISTLDLVKVNDYNIYVFRLCERIKVEGTQRFLFCDKDCNTNDILSIEATQVREELYLLVEKQGDKVIYLTTKTDRSFDIEPDIFNTEAHKNYVFVNDLENIYFGIIESDYINFTNRNETLKFKIASRNNEDCNYTIKNLLSKTKDDTPINNRLVTLNKVYSVPMRFIKTKRILAIQPKKEYSLDTVNSIELNGKRIVFKGNKNSIDGSQRRRLKYHPEFD